MTHSKRNTVTAYLYSSLIGFLICLLAECILQDKFEKNFFENIAGRLTLRRKAFNEDSSIVDALHVTYNLLSNRSAVLMDNSHFNYNIYEGSLINDLVTAKGACGSYAAVLANLLITMGYECRIIQMKVNGLYGGHIVTEVRTKKGWVVLDALYDLFFITPAGTMASFADVSGNWGYYGYQTPEGYNKDYKYEDLRYTNWEKIPVIMPLMKKMLIMTLGAKRTATISIRPLFLRKYRFYSVLLIPLIVFLTFRLLTRKISSRRPDPKILLSATAWARGIRSRFKQSTLKKRISGLGLDKMDCNIRFDSKAKTLRLKLGWPRFNIKSYNGDVVHDIYFYKIRLYDKNAIAQFHYFDKAYFLCNITFTDPDQEEKIIYWTSCLRNIPSARKRMI